MIRGQIKFRCSVCGSTFEGLDLEWMGTVFTTPQRCIQCGSMHTYPKGVLDFINKSAYRKIWQVIDQRETGSPNGDK